MIQDVQITKHRPSFGGFPLLTTLYSEVERLYPRLRLVNAILFFCPSVCFNHLRTALYRWCGAQIGGGSLILGNLSLAGAGACARRLRVGRNCVLNAPLHLDLNAEIRIGDGVSVGHHVVFVTADHELGPSSYRCGAPTHRPIVVEDGCWIGARATILPGVTLGRGCVICAGAVVAADVPPDRMVAGNPARSVKTLE
jgi:maltose O-acetyltransferase